MPTVVGVRPFQCCTPDIAESAGILYMGAQNGCRLVGAASVNQTGVAANYTCSDSSDCVILVDSTGGAYNITLPAVLTGKIIVVKDSGGNALANNVTILTPGAETIDGAANRVLNANYESVILLSDGTNWFVLSDLP